MEHLLELFESDWILAQKAKQTVKSYRVYLEELIGQSHTLRVDEVKQWLLSAKSTPVRRKKAQAVRAFGKWAESNDFDVFQWWRMIPIPKDPVRPQATVTREMYTQALKKARTIRDRALIDVLWSTGLRRSEIAPLEVSDINFGEGFLIVQSSKTGKPRIAPLSPDARKSLIRHLGQRRSGSVFGWNSNSIRVRLVRLGLPSAHAWRRGWAVQSLRDGVSETSVKAAAGWSSGAMVARYTNALSGELAVEEFRRTWR